MKIARSFFRRLLDEGEPIESVHQLQALWAPRAGGSIEQQRLGLSTIEFAVHLVLLYLGDVGNGGHLQFLLNPGGAHANEILASLKRTGLTVQASILTQVCAAFPKGLVPENERERRRLISALSESTLAQWDELDQRLYAQADTWSSLRTYLRANETEVLAPELE